MGVLNLIQYHNAVELDVEVLIHALERASDLDVILELDRDRRVDQRFEEAVRRCLLSVGDLISLSLVSCKGDICLGFALDHNKLRLAGI